MKITITFKDPDAVFESAMDAAMRSMPDGLYASEKQILQDGRSALIREKLGRWILDDEYITVEFDLDAGTAAVKERA